MQEKSIIQLKAMKKIKIQTIMLLLYMMKIKKTIEKDVYKRQQLQPGDFALFISYSGENTSLLECMKILNKKGIQTALVTANLQSPLVVYSQYQIIIPDYEKQNKIATFYSQLAFMYILNNLHALIYHLKNK